MDFVLNLYHVLVYFIHIFQILAFVISLVDESFAAADSQPNWGKFQL